MSWCTIESDPGVFTELIQQIGVKGVQVEEFYDIDQASFNKAKPIYGLIFLFKWQKDEKDNRQPDPKAADTVFFAKQVINNACATQAIINVLLNRTKDVDVGPELTKFKQFAEPLPSDIRGMAMQNSAVLRTVHNSFARPDPFEAFGEKPKKDDDDEDEAFHFIGYVPINDVVYELDGLKGGPIKIGDCKDKDWLEVAHGALKERISRYAAKEVRFNVMGLVKNRKQLYEAELSALEAKQSAGSALEAKAIETQIAALRENIAIEDSKFAAWKAENIRRRHNYVPFAFGLLQALAEKGKLKGLVDSAVKSAEDRKKKKADDKKKTAAAATATAAAAATAKPTGK